MHEGMADRIEAIRGSIDSDRSERLGLLWRKLGDFPMLPALSAQLLESDPASGDDIDALVRAVGADPGLRGAVMALCRCAHRPMRDADAGLERMAAMLGYRRVARVVITAQLCVLLRDESASIAENEEGPDAGAMFDADGLWLHGVAVACAAERIALLLGARGGRVSGPDAFLGGLLSGTGRQVLAMLAPRGYAWTARLAARSGLDASSAERRTLGTDASEVGDRLARRWGLVPAGPGLGNAADGVAIAGPLGACIRAAGEVGVSAQLEASQAELVRIIGLAGWVCRRYHLGWSGSWSDTGDGGLSRSALALSKRDIGGLVPGIVEDAGRCVSLLGFGGPGFSPDRMPLVIAEQANRTLDALIRRDSRDVRGAIIGSVRAA